LDGAGDTFVIPSWTLETSASFSSGNSSLTLAIACSFVNFAFVGSAVLLCSEPDGELAFTTTVFETDALAAAVAESAYTHPPGTAKARTISPLAADLAAAPVILFATLSVLLKSSSSFLYFF